MTRFLEKNDSKNTISKGTKFNSILLLIFPSNFVKKIRDIMNFDLMKIHFDLIEDFLIYRNKSAKF